MIFLRLLFPVVFSLMVLLCYYLEIFYQCDEISPYLVEEVLRLNNFYVIYDY